MAFAAVLAVLLTLGGPAPAPAALPGPAPVQAALPGPAPARAAFPGPAPVQAALPGFASARADDGYRASVLGIDAATARAMTGVSWRRGCPVPLADLRRVGLTYWGFDKIRRRGELIVHKDVARDVVAVFHTLYTARFPIRRMNRVEVYRGSDNASMIADNTSAFNCRPITGSTRGFSVHSYGRAIDLNPMENPYVKGRTVLPPSGTRFTNRAGVRPGMIRRGDRVWRAFTARGFRWGGDWKSLKDYQHFES